MNRFPAFSLYRIGFLSISALVIFGGFVVALILAYQSDLEVPSVITRVGTFIIYYLAAIIVAFGLLTVSELIKVFLSMEDHLYNIRYGDTRSPTSSAHAETHSKATEPSHARNAE